eukprot:2170772-Rhodomonas_salina.2
MTIAMSYAKAVGAAVSVQESASGVSSEIQGAYTLVGADAGHDDVVFLAPLQRRTTRQMSTAHRTPVCYLNTTRRKNDAINSVFSFSVQQHMPTDRDTPDLTRSHLASLPGNGHLEGVDARDLDLVVELFAQRAVALDVAHDVRALALVGRDDADLVGRHAALEEARHNLLHVGRLCAVQVGGARGRQLLRAQRDVEQHRLRRHWPRELERRALALRVRHSVLERALVEGVGRELGERGVHAVLDLEAHGLHAQGHQALEQRLLQTRLGRFLAHHDWRRRGCQWRCAGEST